MEARSFMQTELRVRDVAACVFSVRPMLAAFRGSLRAPWPTSDQKSHPMAVANLDETASLPANINASIMIIFFVSSYDIKNQ